MNFDASYIVLRGLLAMFDNKDVDLLFLTYISALLRFVLKNVSRYHNELITCDKELNLCLEALNERDMNTFKWLISIKHHYCGGIDRIAKFADHELILLLHQQKYQISDSVISDFIIAGNIESLKWCFTDLKYNVRIDHMFLATKINSLDILKLLFDNGGIIIRQLYDTVAKNKNIDMLEWLYSKRKIYPDEQAAYNAVEAGCLVTLKWLYNHRCKFTYHVTDRAIKEGHIHILEWLYYIGYNPSTNVFAMCKNNNPAILWLYNRGVRFDARSTYTAFTHGAFNNLKWLVSKQIKLHAKICSEYHVYKGLYPNGISEWLIANDCACKGERH